jgi:hypothetical protein
MISSLGFFNLEGPVNDGYSLDRRELICFFTEPSSGYAWNVELLLEHEV